MLSNFRRGGALARMNEPLSKQVLIALVDQLILEQGRLNPLEFLMTYDYLCYADYES